MNLFTKYVQDLYAETLMKAVKEQRLEVHTAWFQGLVLSYCSSNHTKTVWFLGNDKEINWTEWNIQEQTHVYKGNAFCSIGKDSFFNK